MKPAHVNWSLYLRNGFARRISKVGERLNARALIYNPLTMRAFHEEGERNAPKVIAAIRRHFPAAKRFLDVGAGSGVFSAELKRQGGTAVALEHSRHGLRMASRQEVDCRPFDLRNTPPAEVDDQFDVVICFEVAEHLPQALGDKLLDFMALFRAPIIFTAAEPGQGGTGHINEQPRQYWIERFVQRGFRYDESLTRSVREDFQAASIAQWFGRNVCVFCPDKGKAEDSTGAPAI